MKEPRCPCRSGGDDRYRDKRVRDAAMVFQFFDRAGKAPENVEIGSFGSERGGQRGVRGLAVESGAANACSSEKVRDGFHSSLKIIIAATCGGAIRRLRGTNAEKGEENAIRPGWKVYWRRTKVA